MVAIFLYFYKKTNMDNNTLLDQVDMPVEHSYEYASQGKRFLNFIIDYILIILVAVALIAIIGIQSEAGFYLIFYPSFWVYYTVLEGLGGRTIGKYLTGTMVVRTEDLQAPSISQCMGRSISRFVPFEPFSFLGGKSGWHDNWTNTMVVNVNSLVR
jgi:uncharacterized RDD family membrane protein YckC